ncbi:hypothetical protein Tco_0661702 [Tanacetum coccineum]
MGANGLTNPDRSLKWLGNLLCSLSQDVYLGHVFSDNVVNVWKELQETYDRIDGSIVFNLMQKINSFKQGGLPVSEYYHKLNSLWREFDILTKLPDCTCAARNELSGHVKLEESHRGIPPSTIKTEKTQVSAFMARQTNNNRNISNNWSNNGNNINRGNYDSLLCKNCGLKGHTVDRCFKLIEYPPGFKRNPNLKPVNGFNNTKSNNVEFKKGNVGNNESKTSAGIVSFTNDQVMKLMSLLNEKSCSTAQANMAGWIIDSGANQHITDVSLCGCKL